MVNEFLHFCQHPRLGRTHILPIVYVDRTVWQFLNDLTQNAHALTHFLDPDQVSVITIPGAANHHVEVVAVVIQVGMFSSKIVLDAATAKVWTGYRIGNRSIL